MGTEPAQVGTCVLPGRRRALRRGRLRRARACRRTGSSARPPHAWRCESGGVRSDRPRHGGGWRPVEAGGWADCRGGARGWQEGIRGDLRRGAEGGYKAWVVGARRAARVRARRLRGPSRSLLQELGTSACLPHWISTLAHAGAVIVGSLWTQVQPGPNSSPKWTRHQSFQGRAVHAAPSICSSS